MLTGIVFPQKKSSTKRTGHCSISDTWVCHLSNVGYLLIEHTLNVHKVSHSKRFSKHMYVYKDNSSSFL